MNGQWVERVVLKNNECAAGGQHSAGFREYSDVFGVINVVQHASHEHEIETAVWKGYSRSVELNERGEVAVPRPPNLKALLRYIETRQLRRGKVVAKKANGRPDPGAKVENSGRLGQPSRYQNRCGIRDFVRGKKFGSLPRQPDVLRVDRAVLFGKLVELCFFHTTRDVGLSAIE